MKKNNKKNKSKNKKNENKNKKEQKGNSQEGKKRRGGEEGGGGGERRRGTGTEAGERGKRRPEEKTGISDQEEEIKVKTSYTVRSTGKLFSFGPQLMIKSDRLFLYLFCMIHQLTNAKSDKETEDSKQPIGMRESGEEAKDTDYETIHINCMSSAKLVCERTNTYSTE